MECDITVIVPCYNGFRYMINCLSALENQTYKRFKVIIVDDCSTDDSYNQLTSYKEQSPLDITLIRNSKNEFGKPVQSILLYARNERNMVGTHSHL